MKNISIFLSSMMASLIMSGSCYGLKIPPNVSTDPNYYLDSSGVPVRRRGAPPAHSESRGFYASSVFTDPGGRTLLLAWVGAFRPLGWNCCMSLPRVLSLDGEHRLIQKPIPELATLRVRHTGWRHTNLHNEARAIEGIAGNTLEVMADILLGTAEAVELSLRNNSSAPAVVIRYDGQALDANGTFLPRVPTDDPRRLKLHLFFDKSVMELFINGGRQTVTRVAYPASTEPLHVECRAFGGEAQINSLDVWRLKAIWPTAPGGT